MTKFTCLISALLFVTIFSYAQPGPKYGTMHVRKNNTKPDRDNVKPELKAKQNRATAEAEAKLKAEQAKAKEEAEQKAKDALKKITF